MLLPLVLVAPAAQAEDKGKGVHFSLSGGVARGLGGPYTFNNPAAGAALSGAAYLELGRILSLGLEAGWTSKLADEQRTDQPVTSDGPDTYDTHRSVSAWRITPALEWRGSTGVFRPRGALALGLYHLAKREQSRSSYANLNYDVTTPKNTGGLGLAVGLDALFLRQTMGLGLELRFDAAFNDVDGGTEFESWWTLSAGVRF
jgi:hypothetical protein